MKQKQPTLPPIGMRIIKSAIGVFLGFIIYFLRGCQGTPFYTALSVLWCTRAYNDEAHKMAFQRSIGTFIGGFYGLIFILAERFWFPGVSEFWRYTIISFSLILVLYTTVLLKKKNASYFACVVYLSVVVLHITDTNPYLFVFNRVLDTLVGIGVALAISMFHLPRKKNRDILFVSGMDDTLLPYNGESLSPYNKVELNRMLDDGALFTVSTMRTPAALVKNLQDIRIHLPVIAMDGAVLYDIKENSYLYKYEASYTDLLPIITMIRNHGHHIFYNRIVGDLWIIYYGDFHNEAEKSIYKNLRRSPYRNYLKKEPPVDALFVYLMIVDETSKIEKLYTDIKTLGWNHQYKILEYASKEYPGYSYIKIYHKDATRQNMLLQLQKMCNARDVITFGSINGAYDVVVHADYNHTVKTLKRLYEPCIWTN